MSNSAKRIYFIVFDDVELLDIAGPSEVLAQANSLLGKTAYDVTFVSSNSQRPIPTSAGLAIYAQALPNTYSDINTVFIPGGDYAALETASQDKTLMCWLDKALQQSRRIASVCTGAFLIGALGHLNKHKVTTHWAAIGKLQEMFPTAEVETDTLYSNDGKLWTSAGVLSGVDMALAIVAKDHGRALALQIARQLVVYLIRDGGQTQFSAPINIQAKAAQGDLLRLSAWLLNNIDNPISVEQMAAYMATSVRSLHRRCLSVFALSPARLFVELRLEQARTLLNDGDLSIKAIALSCGYASSAAFSKAFRQRYGIAPADYRKRFR